MLEALKSLFHRPNKPVIDAVFYPRFPKSFSLGAVPLDEVITFGATGSDPWFDPTSESAQRVLMGTPPALMETDSPPVLAEIAQSKYHPHNECVLYQPWPEPTGAANIRPLGALDAVSSSTIGAALSRSPVKHFYLITGGILPGSLLALKDALKGHRLETLGLFWYYSGDDMTDDPRVIDELAALCLGSHVEKLSLLTAAVDSVAETRLIKGLTDAPLLSECSVFEKDDNGRYPRFRTPMLDQFLRDRGKV